MTDPGPRLHPIVGTFAFVAANLAGALAVTLPLAGFLETRLLLATVVMWLVLIPISLAVGRWLTGLPFEELGLGRTGARRGLAVGLALGAATLLLPAFLGRAFGAMEPTPGAGPANPVGVAWVLPALLIAAFGEEVVFRGVLLRYWQRTTSTPAALVVTATLFTLVHGLNPSASVLGWAGVFLAGLWLGVAFVLSGNLWFCTGLHLGWNVATSLVLGLPVSGFELPSLLRWQTADSDLARRLFGGGFGPEEGIAFHLALTASLMAVLILAPTLNRRSTLEQPEEG